MHRMPNVQLETSPDEVSTLSTIETGNSLSETTVRAPPPQVEAAMPPLQDPFYEKPDLEDAIAKHAPSVTKAFEAASKYAEDKAKREGPKRKS